MKVQAGPESHLERQRLEQMCQDGSNPYCFATTCVLQVLYLFARTPQPQVCISCWQRGMLDAAREYQALLEDQVLVMESIIRDEIQASDSGNTFDAGRQSE